MTNYNKKFTHNQIQTVKSHQIQIQKLFSFDEKLFRKVCTCGKTLFSMKYEHIQTLEQKTILKSPYRCSQRFCPVCNYFRVRNLSSQIVSSLRDLKEADKELLFLTFTVPNCSLSELRKTIQHMNSSFRRMTFNDAFTENVTHWIRTLEVTFKPGVAHPHFHSIFAVDKTYFKHEKYMRTKDWSKLWSRCYKSEKGLIVDARAIKPKKDSAKDAILSAVAELSKYVVKSTQLKRMSQDDFKLVYEQLYRMRFITTSRNITLDESKEEVLNEELWRLIELIILRWDQNASEYKAGKPKIFH